MNNKFGAHLTEFGECVSNLMMILKPFNQVQGFMIPFRFTCKWISTPVTPRLIDAVTCERAKKHYGDTLPDGTPIPVFLDDESESELQKLRTHVVPGTAVEFKLKVNWRSNGDEGNGNNAEAALRQLLKLLLEFGMECLITMEERTFDLPFIKSDAKGAASVRKAFVKWPAHSRHDMIIDAKVDVGSMVRARGAARRMQVRNYLVSFHGMPVDVARMLVL
jgi:hypothetical protein